VKLWAWKWFVREFIFLVPVLSFIGCGAGTSTPALPSQAVSISVQPLSQTVPIGEAATFTVTATGTSPLNYQWSENGVDIAGATSASYTTTAVGLGPNGSTVIGSFQVKVGNAVNSLVSNAASLTVGPRAPKAGDLRYLLWQQVDIPGLFSQGGGAGLVEVSPASIINTSVDDALPTPLGMGSTFACDDDTCVWRYAFLPLPSSMTVLNTSYQGGDYSSFTSDLQSYAGSNIVFTSLDLEPAENAYAVSWVKTAQPGGFDYRLDPVVPAGVDQEAQIQAQATLDGTESRIVTAVSFDASGNAILISYGWTGDTKTVYETQAVVVSPGGGIPSAVISAATTLANDGYFISAFGGNDTDGYILIGARVQGDTLPRSIVQTSAATQPPYPTPVLYLTELGSSTLLYEQ
jgi:hypothetical protein